jgi:hypothetical protein
MAAFDWPEFWNPKVSRRLSEPSGCTFDIAERFSTQQDGDGGSSEGGDHIGNSSGVREQATARPRERRDVLHDVEIVLSDRRGRPQRSSSDVLYYRHAKDWGSGSPVVSAPYWFLSSKEPSQIKGLPPILVFLVVMADWYDGTPAGKYSH